MDTLVTPTDAYLVMELVPLLNLFDYCKQEGRLRSDRVYRISCQLISALSYLHQRNIVHRDIKCENVVFHSYHPERVKLLDFGFAKRLGFNSSSQTSKHLTLHQLLASAQQRLQKSSSMLAQVSSSEDEYIHTASQRRLRRSPKFRNAPDTTSWEAPTCHLTKTFCGSLAYVAPEMLREPRVAYNPKKTDVWSLGVLIYVMATHRMPFKESHGMSRLKKELNAPLIWPRDFVEREFMSTVESILEVNVERRLSIFEIENLNWFRTQAVQHKLAMKRRNSSSFIDMVHARASRASVHS